MNEIYDQVLAYMENTVHCLAKLVPAPRFIKTASVCGFRYREKSIPQAVVQKLARLVSTLYATRILLDHGFFQEVGALKRILDEIQEDVLFLLDGYGKSSSRHKQFLDSFYEEEFDESTAIDSTQKRKMVARQKIWAHNIRAMSEFAGSPINPSQMTEVLRTLHKVYSGYVHAASPHIMEMYGGNPARFHMVGMTGTPHERSHRTNFHSYVLRSIYAFALTVKAFGDDVRFNKFQDYAEWFNQQHLENSKTQT